MLCSPIPTITHLCQGAVISDFLIVIAFSQGSNIYRPLLEKSTFIPFKLHQITITKLGGPKIEAKTLPQSFRNSWHWRTKSYTDLEPGLAARFVYSLGNHLKCQHYTQDIQQHLASLSTATDAFVLLTLQLSPSVVKKSCSRAG